MSYDEFFSDSDKPYAENLNDALLLLDAFDVTVPCEMPVMFSNGEFNSTVDVARKAGVGIVTLKSVGSGITVGTDEISGTGDIVFRVYPNFNGFYKWSKIILEKSGTVSIAFKKTDGTSISATVGSDGAISEAADLKTLQEIDVVLSLTSASITSILMLWINNQTSSRTRTSALLEASQLVNVDGTVAEDDLKAVNGDTVNTALNSLNTSLSADISDLSTIKEDKSNKVTTLDSSSSHYPCCSAVKTVTDTKENSNNKVTTLDNNSSHYPSCTAVNTGLNTKEDKNNKVTTLDNTTTNYPSCSAVTAALNGKANSSHNHNVANITDLFDKIYPVGSIYMSVNNVNPGSLFGGTWSQIKDKFLLAKGDTYATNGATGGESTHTLTVDEMPSHNHTQVAHSHSMGTDWSAGASGGYDAFYHTSGRKIAERSTQSAQPYINNTGGGQSHNNMPPYLVVNVWKRIA